MVPLELSTARLRLRVADPGLAGAVARYYRDNREHLQPSSPTFPASVTSRSSWEQRLGRHRDLARAGWEYRYFLLEKSEDRVVGTANLTEVARQHAQQCQLGFGLARNRQGQGLMREALRRVLDFAFAELRLMKVRAHHLPDNERSSRLLESLGFAVEGLARSDVCIDGVWRDHVMRAALNPDPSRVICNAG